MPCGRQRGLLVGPDLRGVRRGPVHKGKAGGAQCKVSELRRGQKGIRVGASGGPPVCEAKQTSMWTWPRPAAGRQSPGEVRRV